MAKSDVLYAYKNRDLSTAIQELESLAGYIASKELSDILNEEGLLKSEKRWKSYVEANSKTNNVIFVHKIKEIVENSIDDMERAMNIEINGIALSDDVKTRDYTTYIEKLKSALEFEWEGIIDSVQKISHVKQLEGKDEYLNEIINLLNSKSISLNSKIDFYIILSDTDYYDDRFIDMVIDNVLYSNARDENKMWLFAFELSNGVDLEIERIVKKHDDVVDLEKLRLNINQRIENGNKNIIRELESGVYASQKLWNEFYELFSKLNTMNKTYVAEYYDEEFLQRLEKNDGIIFNDDQRKAIKSIVEHKVSFLFGEGGTGKTTIAKAILDMIKEQSDKDPVIFAGSFTGKASTLIGKNLGCRLDEEKDENENITMPKQCDTLDKLISCNKLPSHKDIPVPRLSDIDILIVDECSMVSLSKIHYVVKHLPEHARIIMIGDNKQLPPVNAIAYLNELEEIDGIVNFIELTTPVRQQGHLYDIVHASRNEQLHSSIDCDGDKTIEDNGDIVYQSYENDGEINCLIEKYVSMMNDVKENEEEMSDFLNNTRFLCGTNKEVNSINTIVLNYLFDEMHSPMKNCKRVIKDNDRTDVLYKGERVIYNAGKSKHREVDGSKYYEVKRGMTGIIEDFCTISKSDSDKREIFIYDCEYIVVYIEDIDKHVKIMVNKNYPYRTFAMLKPAYATTIHKAQGATIDNVLLTLKTSGVYYMYNKQLIYTAFSRARKRLIVSSNTYTLKESLKKDVYNNERMFTKYLKEYLDV